MASFPVRASGRSSESSILWILCGRTGEVEAERRMSSPDDTAAALVVAELRTWQMGSKESAADSTRMNEYEIGERGSSNLAL